MPNQMSVCSVGNQGSHKQRKGIFTRGWRQYERVCEGGCQEGGGVVKAAKSGVKATQSVFSASHTKRPSESERGGGRGGRAKTQWNP